MIKFLVDENAINEWNLEGLPTDELSIENGIMMTKSSRYPLMIDPQGQAWKWIFNREKDAGFPNWITNLKDPKLKDKICTMVENGGPFLLENVENEMDPMLDPILEKQIVQKGRSLKLYVADAEIS